MTSIETPPVAESFARIVTWAKANCPLLVESLRPGANAEQLAGFEALIGQALPEDLRALYRLADGQIPFQFGRTPDYPGMFVSLPFNPLDIVARHWRLNQEMLSEMDEDTGPPLPSYPPGAVKSAICNNSWIPISDDAGGNHMGIDLDPGHAGDIGQWIIFGTDEFELFRAASSFGAFLHWVAGEMEAGHFAASDAGDWRWRNSSHLHDALGAHLKAGGRIG